MIFGRIPAFLSGNNTLIEKRENDIGLTNHGMQRAAPKSSPNTAELEGATLVILHALQEAFGYVPEAAIPMVASGAQPVARRSSRRLHLLS